MLVAALVLDSPTTFQTAPLPKIAGKRGKSNAADWAFSLTSFHKLCFSPEDAVSSGSLAFAISALKIPTLF